MPPYARRRSFHPNENEKISRLRLQPAAHSSQKVGLACTPIPKNRQRSRAAPGRNFFHQLLTSLRGICIDVGNVYVLVIERLSD
jgi:hypothetical protein